MVASKTIMLSAGGTGGHVFPAIALAQELLGQGHKVVFATDHRTANYDFPEGVEVHVLASKSPSGGLSGKLSGGMGLLKACFQAWRLIGKTKPNTVVGFGGYPSFPAVVIAILRRVPLVLHEQNRYLGKVNRLAAKFAKKVALSFPDTKGMSEADKAKAVEIGNPARPDILALREEPYKVAENSPLELLVFAGSQGARVFSEIVPEAIALLPQTLRERLTITQQCRAEDAARVTQEYADLGIKAEIQPFFDDMADRLKRAHLVLSRSGASTVTEMMVAGRPAIYVPLAIAADDHQTLNAQYMESNQAGWLLPSSQFEAGALAARLEYCLSSTEIMQQTAQSAHGLARIDAAGDLTKTVLKVAI